MHRRYVMSIKRIVATAPLGFVAVSAACSGSSSDGDADSCGVAGTYLATASNPTGTCMASAGDTATDTFEVSSDGATANLTIAGLIAAPGCPGSIQGCTWTAACTLTVTDATGPVKTATVRYAYTFGSGAFTGTASLSVPPATSLPQGCEGSEQVRGTRK